MKVLVVYAHGWNPQSSSFNHAVLEEFTKGLKDGGIPLKSLTYTPLV